MRIRIKEVAERAGVSASTVSKVLSGHDVYAVRAETAQRVRQVARDLGYVPDVAARNLRTRRTGQLGVVLEAVGASEPDELLGDPSVSSAVRRTFDGAIMAGLSGAARELGVPALVVYPGGGHALHTFLDGRVDGLLVGCDPLRGHGLLASLAQATLPVVALWTQRVPESVGAVDVDHAGGAALATAHLIGLGHTRIVFYGGGIRSGVEHFARRQEGYARAMASAGLPALAALHDGPSLLHAVREGVSAVVAETDLGAAAAYRALRSAGLRVPDDVSLIGFDDIQGAEYIAGGLSTVYHPAAEMAAEGVQALMRRLSGEAPRQQLIPARLVLRRSTAAPRRATDTS
ncbi:LacI family transcriptional regulator [Deinococcus sp. KSM4-11]|uniref:LacI family DNA-binding transcriptional regulator n=1 Tax=Deinococcus sp. KSM4-11 TaxID=2568654 RepID=UPI0010A43BFC|nr:LacI family DNA-binding transcriptional regulator [Deinococcus sp. KSM4-11]THF87922.1 LacI family transcriptional regulator [Deinococcus sp. KSM4-11]